MKAKRLSNRKKKIPAGVSKARRALIKKPFKDHTTDLIKLHTGGKMPKKPKYDGTQHKDTAKKVHEKSRVSKDELDKIREENGGVLPRNPNSNKGKPKGCHHIFKPASKRSLWLAHYLNESNADTFLNKANSAIAAGYKPENASQIGLANYYAMAPIVEEWIDKIGLSEGAIKEKLWKLFHAKQTKFFADKGVVIEERQIEDLAIQKSALELAAKIKGMSAPKEVNHNHSYNSEVTENKTIKIQVVDGPGKPVEIEDMKKIGSGEVGNGDK